MSQTHYSIPSRVSQQEIDLCDEIDNVVESFVDGTPMQQLYYSVFADSVYEKYMYHVLVEFYNPIEGLWMILLNPRVLGVHFLLPNKYTVEWSASKPIPGVYLRHMVDKRWMPRTNLQWAVRRVWYVDKAPEILKVIADSIEQTYGAFKAVIYKRIKEFEQVDQLVKQPRLVEQVVNTPYVQRFKSREDLKQSILKHNPTVAQQLQRGLKDFQKTGDLESLDALANQIATQLRSSSIDDIYIKNYENTLDKLHQAVNNPPKPSVVEFKRIRLAATNFRETLDCFNSTINDLLKCQMTSCGHTVSFMVVPWYEWFQIQFLIDLKNGNYAKFRRSGITSETATILLQARLENDRMKIKRPLNDDLIQA